MNSYVVVAGNIGAGKSTLVEGLSKTFSWKAYYEPVAENPYLGDFYVDMEQWAYKCQMYFLSDRLAMHRNLQDYNGSVVQDRSVYEDAQIFAKNLHNSGYIDHRDYGTYTKLYGLLVEMLRLPDLIVYLKASVKTLMKHIASRGRDFEAAISEGYLEQLNVLYEQWIGGWTHSRVLTVNMDEIDFSASQDHFDLVAGNILETLRGDQGELF